MPFGRHTSRTLIIPSRPSPLHDQLCSSRHRRRGVMQAVMDEELDVGEKG